MMRTTPQTQVQPQPQIPLSCYKAIEKRVLLCWNRSFDQTRVHVENVPIEHESSTHARLYNCVEDLDLPGLVEGPGERFYTTFQNQVNFKDDPE